MPEITLRAATISDLAILRHWDEQPHTIHSDPNDDWNWEVELLVEHDWRKQLIAELDERPIGFIQIIDPAKENTRYWGNIGENLRAIDIWIGEEKDLGKGYGTTMMKLALAICFSDEYVRAVIIDPLVTNTRAIRFYQRIGFHFVEDRHFDEDYCSVHRLDREVWMKMNVSTGN